jgi:hypothetical protein
MLPPMAESVAYPEPRASTPGLSANATDEPVAFVLSGRSGSVPDASASRIRSNARAARGVRMGGSDGTLTRRSADRTVHTPVEGDHQFGVADRCRSGRLADASLPSTDADVGDVANLGDLSNTEPGVYADAPPLAGLREATGYGDLYRVDLPHGVSQPCREPLRT